MKVKDIAIGLTLFKPDDLWDTPYVKLIHVRSIVVFEEPHNVYVVKLNDIRFQKNNLNGELYNSEYFFNEQEALKVVIERVKKRIEPLQEKLKHLEARVKK